MAQTIPFFYTFYIYLEMGKIEDYAIFGEYKNPEDKVTAALLQVLHHGGQEIVCSVFDGIGVPSNDIVVESQVSKEETRPDGLVSCDCKYKIYIESKIVCNVLKNDHEQKQLEANKKLSSPADNQWMIYVTPDEDTPKELGNTPIIWVNWQTIVDRLKGYDSKDTLVSFLIEQFCLYVDKIVFNKKKGSRSNGWVVSSDPQADKDQRVIIVGGAWGEDVALDYGFYACQANRYFLPAKYLAFYHKNRIENLFEIEDTPVESIVLTEEFVDKDYFVKKDINYDQTPRKYFKLKHIKRLEPVIENDSVDKNGKPCAFVQGQRYTTYDAIMNAKKTSEL